MTESLQFSTDKGKNVNNNHRYLSPLLFLTLILLVVYSRVTFFDFVWDDNSIRDAKSLFSRSDIFSLAFLEPYGMGNYYRPLPMLMFAVESLLGGFSGGQVLGHLVNLLLLAGISILVYLISVMQFPAADNAGVRVVALLSALAYGLHPLLLSGPAWISTRFDLMVTFCALAMLWAGVAPGLGKARSLLVIVLFALAMFCKESAVVLLLVYPLWLLYCRDRQFPAMAMPARWQEVALASAGMVAVLAGYLFLRLQVMDLWVQVDNGDYAAQGVAVLWRMLQTLGWAARLMLFPFFALQPLYPAELPLSLSTPHTLLGLAVLLCALLLAIFRPLPVRLVLAMLACSMAPFMNILFVPLRESLVAPWYFFLPAALLAITVFPVLIQWLLQLPYRSGQLLLAGWFVSALLLIYTVLPNWKDNTSLWQWAEQHHPGSGMVTENLFYAHFTSGRFSQALVVGEKMRVAAPRTSNFYFLMAIAAMRAGDMEKLHGYGAQGLRVAGKPHERASMMAVAAEMNLMENRIDDALSSLAIAEQNVHIRPYTDWIRLKILVHRHDWQNAVRQYNHIMMSLGHDPSFRSYQLRYYGLRDDDLSAMRKDLLDGQSSGSGR